MSTRAVIARALGAQGSEYSRWEGRYHHHTGYPQGLGKRLYELAHELGHEGVAPMLALLVDEHPAGWSNIFGCDMSKAPGYRGLTDEYMAMTVEQRIADDAAHGPECYCHDGRRAQATLITNPGSDYDTEWCYAIDEATGAMTIYRRGEHPSRWVYVATVRLLSDDPEPDWRLLRDRGDVLIGRTPIRLTRRPGVIGCYPIDQQGRFWASISCPPTPCALCDVPVTRGWSLGKSDAVICSHHARYEDEPTARP